MSESSSSGRGGSGCAALAPLLVGIVLVLAACVAGPYWYFFEDYEYVRGTARAVQDVGVFAAQALSWGLVGLLVGFGCYAVLGLFGGWFRWASPGARDAYLQIELARAQHMELPDSLSSYQVTHNYNQRGQLAPVEPAGQAVIEGGLAPPVLAGPLPHDEASFVHGTSRIAQLVSRGHIALASERLLVGYAGEQPLHLRASEWGLAIIAGQSGKGKSSLAGLIIAQAALNNWCILACDPVYHREERSLLKDYLSGMSGAIYRQAVTAEEIAATIGLAMKIAQRRLDYGDRGERVLLVVDEFSTVAGRKVLDADAMENLFLTATKAAAVGVHTLLIAHDLSGSWFGGQAARRGRDQATHRLICNMSPTAAAAILPNQAYGQQVAILPVGQALYFDGWQEPQLASFPRLSPEDLAWAAGSRTPRPYRPWVAPVVIAHAPTEPIGAPAPATPMPALRAAPPTTQLELSAREQILDVLRATRLELDAREIARRAGMPEGTVRNVLGDLRADGLITNRRDGRSFVYSLSAQPATT